MRKCERAQKLKSQLRIEVLDSPDLDLAHRRLEEEGGQALRLHLHLHPPLHLPHHLRDPPHLLVLVLDLDLDRPTNKTEDTKIRIRVVEGEIHLHPHLLRRDLLDLQEVLNNNFSTM